MTRDIPGDRDAHPVSRGRRRLLKGVLSCALLAPVALLAGCANRKDLPPERRSRGRGGDRGGGLSR